LDAALVHDFLACHKLDLVTADRRLDIIGDSVVSFEGEEWSADDEGWVLKFVGGHHGGDFGGEVVHVIAEVVHAFECDADVLLVEVSSLDVGGFVLALG
jgi:hypothetical protein